MDHVLSFCTILQKFRLMILFHDEVWSGKLIQKFWKLEIIAHIGEND